LNIEEAWAAHQMRTTSNFAMDNKVLSWFVGGLNFQIEHHLFPKISHVHYPELSKIVKRLAAKHQLPYYCIDGFLPAVQSHFKTMRTFGSAEGSNFLISVS
jgi:linoleoyl-CoA desaturase